MSSRSRPESLEARALRLSPDGHLLDVKSLLDSVGWHKKICTLVGKETMFVQGDPAKKIMYIQEGGVKLTVVNAAGKEAVVAILGPGDFAGETCLAGQPLCSATATAITSTTALVIEKRDMIRILRQQQQFSDVFIAYMLARNVRIEDDLVDQLFNSSEKRLARALLLLARDGEKSESHEMLHDVSQEMLAEMIGTTRPRISGFMTKFKRLGFIAYGGRLRGLQVNTSLLSVVQGD
jgi:CRP/FNR family transcriptional regulator, cyclic AMP receptor protein